MGREQESLKEWKETEDRLKTLYTWTRRSGWTWQAAGALLSLGGGAFAAAVGSLLSAVAWARGDEAGGLSMHGVGSVLLFSTIPLLIFGACCLDLLDKRVDGAREVTADREGSAAARSVRARSGMAAAAVLLTLLCGMASRASAQQTVFNVPTTDVLDKGKVYVELDASLKPNDDEAVSRFSSFVPRVVVGAGHNVEVGLNVLGNAQPGPDATTLVPNVKWRFYRNENNGWAMVAGAHLYVPVHNRAYDAGNYSYVITQKSFKTGTRVGAGGYFFSKNVVAPNANRAGGQFTFEQPVNGKVTLAADWFTGKHANGYFTPGVILKVGRKTTAYAAYSIGNQNAARGNHFFLLELGYNFN